MTISQKLIFGIIKLQMHAKMDYTIFSNMYMSFNIHRDIHAFLILFLLIIIRKKVEALNAKMICRLI